MGGVIVTRAFRYRLEPTSAQHELFARTAGACRFVGNAAVEHHNVGYRMWVQQGRPAGRRPNQSWQGRSMELPAAKRTPGLEWLAAVPSHCLNQALIDVDRAFKNFFAGRAGYPRMKRKGDNDSFRYPDPKQVKTTPARRKQVFLPKAGWVRLSMSKRSATNYGVRYDRPWRGRLRHVTVKREGDEWWVSFACEVELADPTVDVDAPKPSVGVDRGVVTSFMPSAGEPWQVPVPTKAERAKLARLDRAVSRKRRGSKNREKAKEQRRRYVRTLVRRRHDMIVKTTTAIAKNHSVVAVEELRVKNMSASARGTVEAPGRNVRAKAGLNRAILAQCWGRFVAVLERKCAEHGAVLVPVPARHTSQTCAECGVRDGASRVSRDRFECRHCGHADDADRNAARVIEQRAQAKVKAWLRAQTEHTAGSAGSACRVA